MDDSMIVYILVGGGVILLLIVVFGVLSSRKKARAATLTRAPEVVWEGGEPVLQTESLELVDKRQGELFRASHPVGSALTVSVPGEGGPQEHTLHVARHGTQLRAGWPQAKKAYVAYFAEFEGAGLPASGPVKGNRKVVRMDLDAQGITGYDRDGAVTFSGEWPSVMVSVGDDVILGANGQTIHVTPEGWPLGHLAGKYGTFKQLHF